MYLKVKAGLLVFASIAAAFIILEIGLILTGFSYQLRAVVVESTGPVDDVLYKFYKIDSDFIWVPHNYYNKLDKALANRPDLLFIGDSCTEFGNYDHYFEAFINRNLPGLDITTIKLGVAGWTSHQGLQQVRRDVSRIKPRFVTVYFGWNDHWNSIGIPDYEVSRLIAAPLFRHQKIRTVQLMTKAYVSFKAARNQRPPVRVSPERFADNLSAIVDIVKGYGGIPILLTAPTSIKKGHEPKYLGERWLTDINDLIPLHQKYAGIVRKVAGDKKAILCDLAARVDKIIESGNMPGDLFSADGIHLEDQGDKVVAGSIYECLQDNTLLQLLKPVAASPQGGHN